MCTQCIAADAAARLQGRLAVVDIRCWGFTLLLALECHRTFEIYFGIWQCCNQVLPALLVLQYNSPAA